MNNNLNRKLVNKSNLLMIKLMKMTNYNLKTRKLTKKINNYKKLLEH